MNRPLLAVLALAASIPAAEAFCGFYVAQADASLFNNSSQVVLARDGNHTSMTMANDYQGALSEFAMVIPVPVAVKREDVVVSDKALVDVVDRYSGPRLTEYYDADPCPDPRAFAAGSGMSRPAASAPVMEREDDATGRKEKSLGVTILDSYQVGEYDILILSAKESEGLQTWLNQEGYRIPAGAGDVLTSYIRQNMKFFVAKVNLKEKSKDASPTLRPLRVSYDSPKFMLPIRLGMANAHGTQELFIYTITPKGRVETTNYRTAKLPTQIEVPVSVQTNFGPFYKALFNKTVQKEGMATVFTEYAWPLTVACDPCSSDPITSEQLRTLGASWVTDQYGYGSTAFLTRLHVRYDWAHFPEDLIFQETPDQTPWQAVYSIRHPFTGDTSCAAGKVYRKDLEARLDKDASNLSMLTGWANPRRKDGANGFWQWNE